MIVGVGLMGQYLAQQMNHWLDVSTLTLVDANEDINVDGESLALKEFAVGTMYFWSNECWCVGEILTTDSGYTKHQPIYGHLKHNETS